MRKSILGVIAGMGILYVHAAGAGEMVQYEHNLYVAEATNVDKTASQKKEVKSVKKAAKHGHAKRHHKHNHKHHHNKSNKHAPHHITKEAMENYMEEIAPEHR